MVTHDNLTPIADGEDKGTIATPADIESRKQDYQQAASSIGRPDPPRWSGALVSGWLTLGFGVVAITQWVSYTDQAQDRSLGQVITIFAAMAVCMVLTGVLFLVWVALSWRAWNKERKHWAQRMKVNAAAATTPGLEELSRQLDRRAPVSKVYDVLLLFAGLSLPILVPIAWYEVTNGALYFRLWRDSLPAHDTQGLLRALVVGLSVSLIPAAIWVLQMLWSATRRAQRHALALKEAANRPWFEAFDDAWSRSLRMGFGPEAAPELALGALVEWERRKRPGQGIGSSETRLVRGTKPAMVALALAGGLASVTLAAALALLAFTPLG